MSDNELIAEFMGLEHANETHHDTLYSHTDWEGGEWAYGKDDLCYHKSWDWLMPVVEKISQLGEDGHVRPESKVYKVIDLNLTTSIKGVHQACVEFIKWYNSQK